jgi:ligand-binding sensor domain-containing protein
MTDLSANIHRPHKGHVEDLAYGLVGYTNYQGGSAGYTAYKGAPMIFDVSNVDGYVQPLLTTITPASGDVFLGLAQEKKVIDSTITADNAEKILVARKGIFGFPKGSIAVTDIGAPAYMTDSNTVITSSSNSLWIGTIVGLDDTYVWVDIGDAAGRANTAT